MFVREYIIRNACRALIPIFAVRGAALGALRKMCPAVSSGVGAGAGGRRPAPWLACVRSTSRRAPRHVYADKFSWQELVQ